MIFGFIPYRMKLCTKHILMKPIRSVMFFKMVKTSVKQYIFIDTEMLSKFFGHKYQSFILSLLQVPTYSIGLSH